MGNKIAKKVLLIGWDAADWNIINPLMDSGQMPALESLVNRGVIANLATLEPPLSPMLWTSIATGHTADKHGILGFAEPDAEKGGVRPVNVTSRKVKALWNIFHYKNMKSNVVSWWPSHPVEPINGVMISNFFQQHRNTIDKPWPMQPNTIHPESMKKTLRKYRVHPQELTAAHILPFVPDAAQIVKDKEDKRLESLVKITAQAASVHAVSTYLMENTEWDFMAVYFDAIDHYCHAFMKFHPPLLRGIPEKEFNLYKDVVKGGYIFHDMMLDRILKLVDDDTTIILISDHGFHSDHRRPLVLPKLPAAPAFEHSPYGVFCAAGPGIKKDERIYGASLLDITPTILTLFGLPVGKDMSGKVLSNIFENPVEPEFIDSWENIEGDFGMHDPNKRENVFEAAEALNQLVELGYIEDPGEDKKKAMERTSNEAQYNLSRVYTSKNQYDKAIEILEDLFKKDSKDLRFNLDLAKIYLSLMDVENAERIISNLRQIESRALANIDLLEGKLLIIKNKPIKALEMLQKVEESNPLMPGLHIELGKLYLNARKYKDAERSFAKALQIDDENAGAFHGLGLAMLRQNRLEEAADNILNAIGLMYHFPPAHYHLGEVLMKMEKYKEAIEAFEVCLKMAPNLLKARQWLVILYREKLINQERADFHEQIIKNVMKGEIIIVSGLPRSGTSMMMQMLEAGGIEPLTDQKRKADDNNPKGYYEFEEVKKLKDSSEWLENAQGKSVKIIAQLLKYLPKKYKYKIVFMQRDMYEVIQSQQKMLGRAGDAFPVAISNAFKNELERISIWHEKEPNVEMLYVDYKNMIANPDVEINKLIEFINKPLDKAKMMGAIDPNLYRNKNQ